MDNRTITLQELLEYMSMLRDDMNALTVAFSYLASSLPKEQMIQILHSFILNQIIPDGLQNSRNLSNG